MRAEPALPRRADRQPRSRRQLELLTIAARCARRGHAVVMIVHDLNLAALAAARVVVLDRCAVVASGSPVETVTDDVVDRVFGVTNAVNRVPAPPSPFILPHGAKRTR